MNRANHRNHDCRQKNKRIIFKKTITNKIMLRHSFTHSPIRKPGNCLFRFVYCFPKRCENHLATSQKSMKLVVWTRGYNGPGAVKISGDRKTWKPVRQV